LLLAFSSGAPLTHRWTSSSKPLSRLGKSEICNKSTANQNFSQDKIIFWRFEQLRIREKIEAFSRATEIWSRERCGTEMANQLKELKNQA
jgi:hypothetical protein